MKGAGIVVAWQGGEIVKLQAGAKTAGCIVVELVVFACIAVLGQKDTQRLPFAEGQLVEIAEASADWVELDARMVEPQRDHDLLVAVVDMMEPKVLQHACFRQRQISRRGRTASAQLLVGQHFVGRKSMERTAAVVAAFS